MGSRLAQEWGLVEALWGLRVVAPLAIPTVLLPVLRV